MLYNRVFTCLLFIILLVYMYIFVLPAIRQDASFYRVSCSELDMTFTYLQCLFVTNAT